MHSREIAIVLVTIVGLVLHEAGCLVRLYGGRKKYRNQEKLLKEALKFLIGHFVIFLVSFWQIFRSKT